MSPMNRDDVKREIMRAARHLSPSRMKWVVARHVGGYDFAGAPKGMVAETVSRELTGGLTGPRVPVDKIHLARIVGDMRRQRNTRGETQA